MKFEWNEEKAKANFKKHGVLFESAVKVFLDQNLLEIYDEEHSTADEERYVAIGGAGDLLFVVYTERGENIRLISARLATKQERRLYYGHF